MIETKARANGMVDGSELKDHSHFKLKYPHNNKYDFVTDNSVICLDSDLETSTWSQMPGRTWRKKELKGTTSHYDSDQCIVILDTTDADSDLDHTITELKSAAKECDVPGSEEKPAEDAAGAEGGKRLTPVYAMQNLFQYPGLSVIPHNYKKFINTFFVLWLDIRVVM